MSNEPPSRVVERVLRAAEALRDNPSPHRFDSREVYRELVAAVDALRAARERTAPDA